MVRASALQSVELVFNPLVKSYQKTLKNGIHSFPAWRLAIRGVVENKPASSLVVFLDKALGGTFPPLCERQAVQTPQKWQLPSKYARPVRNIATQFAFS